ncbi:hypothetical protein KO498_07210 [Lentibacter algarum]|uniref:hypothetical protein n=1 Tax=Lentibacter algarum TaxID=576131 RepID=UPI001C075D31|nr:hypothetical protein [Lentibacter algarum]MBU2981602.1 hypothetical protein [Lentibacter algarum]
MSDLIVTKRRLIEGKWEGVVSRADGGTQPETPRISVTLEGKQVEGIALKQGAGNDWELCVPVPSEAISDGLRTVLVQDSQDGTVLAGIALLCGEALDEDIRSEVELLRQELDMLKRAFRRHCVETS